ncbi:MAG: hypothetical protein V3R48_06020, partial [Thermoplasmata archaeon]
MPRGTNSVQLLKDEDVRRWYENLARGSDQTARERLRVLARLCRLIETTPQEMLKSQSVGNGFEDALMDFVEIQRKEGRAPGYLKNYVKAARSWMEYNGLPMRRRIKVGNASSS